MIRPADDGMRSPARQLMALLWVCIAVALPDRVAVGETLAAALAGQFDAELLLPPGAIAAPGQLVGGARQLRFGAASVLDVSRAIVCRGPAGAVPGANSDGDDIVAEGAFTIAGEAAALTEVEAVLGLSRSDVAAVEAIGYRISASIEAPQSKTLAAGAGASKAACVGAGPDARIVTSVVTGNLALTIDLKHDTPAGAAAVMAQRMKIALDPTGRRFALALSGGTITLASRQRLVIGANIEPLAKFTK